MTAPQTPADPDPMPEAPLEPDFAECCGNGCEPCIFDLHAMAMEQYRRDLRAWEERQAQRGRG